MNLSRLRLIDGIAATAIIGGVTAFVYPVIGDTAASQDQKDAVTCMSNLHQLALGDAQYVQDYDEEMPSGANWNGSGSGWAQQIYPYVVSTAVFKCPSDADPHDVVSYGYNSNLVRLTGYHPSAPVGLPLRAMSSPSNTVLFFEVAGDAGANGETYRLDGNRDIDGETYKLDGKPNLDIHSTIAKFTHVDGWSPAGRGIGDGAMELTGMGDNAKEGISPLQYATGHMRGSSDKDTYFLAGDGRHNGRSMFALLDGHVKSMTPAEVSAGMNDNLDNSCNAGGKAANTSCMGQDGLTATFSAF